MFPVKGTQGEGEGEGEGDREGDKRSASPADKELELQPTTPRQAVPFTPRTQAFHTLDRKLAPRATRAPTP
jgi:hypothetical protein